jgi:RNA polymerase sigma-70 factor (ECF subfamily)
LITDLEIIKQITEGDINQYRILVERYQQMIFRTCMGFLHDRDDADDLVQDIFIQAYQALPQFRQQSSFSTWLYRIAVNAALNKVRKNSRSFLLSYPNSFSESDDRDNTVANVSDYENPEEILIRDEHRAWIQKALDSLPTNQRTALILSKYDDLPQKEIAAIMKTTEGAVEALIQRAKANLRKLLASGKRKPE